MVDFDKLTDKAKELAKDVNTDELKEAAGELKDIATGEGSIADKAKEAAEVVKETFDGSDETEAQPESGTEAPGDGTA